MQSFTPTKKGGRSQVLIQGFNFFVGGSAGGGECLARFENL